VHVAPAGGGRWSGCAGHVVQFPQIYDRIVQVWLLLRFVLAVRLLLGVIQMVLTGTGAGGAQI
jgi:hypothetical protein